MFENGLIQHLDERLAERGILKVVEIGGGFGGLAHYLTKIFKDKLRYVIVDIPESLAFSAVYLTTLHAHADNRLVAAEGPIGFETTPGFTFVANFDHGRLIMADDEVDLVLNTLSLSEMSDAQIDDYCRAASRWIGRRGIFFEQNHQSNHLGPGDIPPLYLKNLRKCTTRLLPTSFPARRGDANFWVNASYRG
jgi:putative sugar O-methyltransferase